MRHRLFVHLTWTTRDRASLIDLPRAEFLGRFLPAVARQERASVLALGMVSTHVHLLLRLDPATGISRLVQRLKGGSAVLAGREGHGPRDRPLRWARGYNLESVSPRAIPVVVDYVMSQARRHPHEAIAGWVGEPWGEAPVVVTSPAAESRL
jgi:REP element-mobilizing transposase RayT